MTVYMDQLYALPGPRACVAFYLCVREGFEVVEHNKSRTLLSKPNKDDVVLQNDNIEHLWKEVYEPEFLKMLNLTSGEDLVKCLCTEYRWRKKTDRQAHFLVTLTPPHGKFSIILNTNKPAGLCYEAVFYIRRKDYLFPYMQLRDDVDMPESERRIPRTARRTERTEALYADLLENFVDS